MKPLLACTHRKMFSNNRFYAVFIKIPALNWNDIGKKAVERMCVCACKCFKPFTQTLPPALVPSRQQTSCSDGGILQGHGRGQRAQA